jgi:hypothetical protein
MLESLFLPTTASGASPRQPSWVLAMKIRDVIKRIGRLAYGSPNWKSSPIEASN